MRCTQVSRPSGSTTKVCEQDYDTHTNLGVISYCIPELVDFVTLYPGHLNAKLAQDASHKRVNSTIAGLAYHLVVEATNLMIGGSEGGREGS